MLIYVLVNLDFLYFGPWCQLKMIFGCKVRFSPIPGSMSVSVCFWVVGVFCFMECRRHNCSHVLTFVSVAELGGPPGSRVCDVLWCVCLMFDF